MRLPRPAEPAAYRILTRLVSAVPERPNSQRELIAALVSGLPAAVREQLADDCVYYYESREGAYDYLIEHALKLGIILPKEGGYIPGANVRAWLAG